MPAIMPIAMATGVAGLGPLLLCIAFVAIIWFLLRRGKRAPPTDAPMVLVINLDKNEQRLQRFMENYEDGDFSQLALHRLPAIDGSDVDWSKFLSPEALEALLTVQKTGFRKTHPELTPGAVGCYLSHMQAWRTIADSGRPFGIVFEDDAAIPPDALLQLYTALKSAPPDWDIVLLGYAGYGQLVSPVLTELHSFLLLHAYAISAHAARVLADSMLPITRQVDWELSDRIKTRGLKVFGLNPSLVKQDWQGTDIQIPLQAKSQSQTQSRTPVDLKVNHPLQNAIVAP